MTSRFSAFFLFLVSLHPLLANPAKVETTDEKIKSGKVSVVYVTDLEGNWEKLEHFYSNNPAFNKGTDGKYHLNEGYYFVYGGDATDRHPGGPRILEDLLRQKTENPQTVVLISGNRDILKMRIPSELKNKRPITLKNKKYKEYLTSQANTADTPENQENFRLMMLMGGERGLEQRRVGLADSRKVSASAVSNKEVVDDFIAETGKNGRQSKYLSETQLAFRLGDILFVHGGVTADALGVVPGQKTKITDVNQWIHELNHWYKEGVERWRRDPLGSHKAIVEYAFGKDMEDPEARSVSVVADANIGPFNNPVLPPEEVIEALMKQGIKRIVIGHTPPGELPVVVRAANGFEVWVADNSFAKNESLAHKLTFSGKNFEYADVEATPKSVPGVRGKVSFRLQWGTASPVGSRLEDGSNIVMTFNDGTRERFLTTRLADGFKEIYQNLSAAELKSKQIHVPRPYTAAECAAILAKVIPE